MRNVSTVAGVALALGILTSAFAPGTAMAETLPDLVAGALYDKSIEATENATIPVVVKNDGDKPAVGAEVSIKLGPGLPLRQPVNAAGWSCTAPVRSNDDGSTSFTCATTETIQPDQVKTIALDVRGEPNQDEDEFYLELSVDPNAQVKESDEDDNDDVSHY